MQRFVKEVLETIELEEIKDAMVGVPGQSGLSTEQRMRLTVAVELVANPSIIFMDEPTTGLDPRAAAIVMRAVKKFRRLDVPLCALFISLALIFLKPSTR